MNLRIKEMRKKSRISQATLASKIGVSLRTIGAWERGETVPDAEQVWDCAEAFGCTPNDVLGWYDSHPSENVIDDAFEAELVGCYRESTVQRKVNILQTARDAAGMSKETAESIASESEGKEVI